MRTPFQPEMLRSVGVEGWCSFRFLCDLAAIVAGVVVAAWVWSGVASAQAISGPTESAAQEKLNPFASAINVAATLGLGFKSGGRDPRPIALEMRPRIPMPLSRDWRIVTRSDVAIVHLPGPPSSTTGLSDVDISAFVTTTDAGKWIWGAGPIVELPAATRSVLGSGKWSVGPTGALAYVDGPWVHGIVVSHLQSVAGPSSREQVGQTQVEIQVSYTFSNEWYVQSAPAFSYNWHAPAREHWVVPIGFDVGRAFTVAAQDISLQVGTYYSLETTSDTPRWSLQLQLAWIR